MSLKDYGAQIGPARGLGFEWGGIAEQGSNVLLSWLDRELGGGDDDKDDVKRLQQQLAQQQALELERMRQQQLAPKGLFGLPPWALLLAALGFLWWLFKGKGR